MNMNTKIYSHHLYEVGNISDDNTPYVFDFKAKPKGIKFIFHSENCFSVQNEKGEYLTAFENGIVKFYAKKCDTWEKFYILDTECQSFIANAINNSYLDARGNIIKEFELFFEKDRLSVMLGSTILSPSYFPAAITEYCNNSVKYETIKDCVILNKKTS